MTLQLEFCLVLLCGVYFALGGKPAETTLTLTTDGAEPETIRYGQKSTLTLRASFSAETTDVVIELLPSVNETVLALASVVSVKKGAEIIVTGPNWDQVDLYLGKEYTDQDKINYNTRGVFAIGNVTFLTGASTIEADYQINITYQVVMVSMGNNADGAEFMTSCGMEYGDYIWISQLGYLLQDSVAAISEEPTVSAQDVSSIVVGEPLTFDITINLPNVQSTLAVGAHELNNTGDIYVTKMRVKSANEAFAYQMNLNKLVKKQQECPLQTDMTFEFGQLINKESQVSVPDTSTYNITVEITLLSRANMAIVDNQYVIGLSVNISSKEIWVTSFVLTVDSKTLPTFTTFTVGAGELSVSPGFVGQVEIDLDIPEKTEITYTITLTTMEMASTTPAVSFLAVREIFYGSNLVCKVSDPEAVFSEQDGRKLSGLYTFTLNNYGFNDGGGADPNKLTIAVVFMIMAYPEVATDDQHKIFISVNGLTPQEKIVTVGPPRAYPESVDYLFEVVNNCPTNRFQSRSSILFEFTITTERDVIAGPMSIETPIPASLNSSNLIFCGAEIKNVGVNVGCAQKGPITATTSSWLNDGVNDIALFGFDVMCNIPVINDTNADKFTIEIIVQVKDTIEILQNGVNDTFIIGIIYSRTDLFIGKYDIEIMPPTVFPGIDHVVGMTIETNDTVGSLPSDKLTLQWSPDGSSFHDVPFQYNVLSNDGSVTELELKRNLLTKYVRLTNKVCSTGCQPYHSFGANPGENFIHVYGTANKSELVKAYLMFALDHDVNTCFDLPVQSNVSTLPALWFVMKDPNITAPYNLTVSGKSISCNNPGGSQVTMAMFGTGTQLDGVVGKTKKCDFLSEEGEALNKTCRYECNCSGEGCNTTLLFMLHKGETGTEPYQLCDVTISTP